MDIKRAIDLLSRGTDKAVPAIADDEWTEACQMACDALRQTLQSTYSLDAAVADHYRNIGLPMERIDELAAADKAGRLIILPDASFTDKDGEEALRKAMWICDRTNNSVTRYTADAIAEKLCRDTQKVPVPKPESAACGESLMQKDAAYRTISKHIFKAHQLDGGSRKILLILADDFSEAERLAETSLGTASIFVRRIIPTDNSQIYEVG